MAKPDAWSAIHAEREALAADLEKMTDQQWNTQSLCDQWSVRNVLAHMTATAKMTPPRFFVKMAGSRFKFHKMASRAMHAQLGAGANETLANFRSQLTATTKPPGPIEAMVGEAVVHSEDIRRPLGLTRMYPVDLLGQVAEFYMSSNLLLGGKARVANLGLRATDAEWSSGDGPEVSGPLLAIVLAIAGRRAALEDLSGEGVASLRTRM